MRNCHTCGQVYSDMAIHECREVVAVKCTKCGAPLTIDNLAKCSTEHITCPLMPKLQLLVIDLGDSCVVKVEKAGAITDTPYPVLCIGNGLDTAMSIFEGNSYYFRQCKFDKLRAAIDALDGEKPVPRAEMDADCNHFLFYSDPFSHEVKSVDLRVLPWAALVELAGKPLPIWEPKKGSWVQLQGSTMSAFQTDLPFVAWRYTQGAD